MKIKQVIPSVIIAILLSPVANALVIWDTHTDGTAHQYGIVYMTEISWNDAYAWTQNNASYGWHLATVTSAEEQTFLLNNLFNTISDPAGKYWLGAYQDPGQTDPTLGWNWVTGEAWDYTNWSPIYPYVASEDELNLITTGRLAWSWDDYTVDHRIRGFIVERTGNFNVPEPGGLALLGIGLAGLGLQQRRRKLN